MLEPIPADKLRWRCDPAKLPFKSTEDVDRVIGIVGQDSAVEALRFGIECDAPGQNVFVRGLTGTGRMTLVRHLMEEMEPVCRAKVAYCYVHNFAEPDRPRLLAIPIDKARLFKRQVRELAEFIRDELPQALEEKPRKEEREAIDARRQERIEALTRDFEKELEQADLELVTLQRGSVSLPAILPVVDGKPVAPDAFERLHEEGKVSDEQYNAYREKRREWQSRLNEVTAQVHEIQRQSAESLRATTARSVRELLDGTVQSIQDEFDGDGVEKFLREVVDDLVENRLFGGSEEGFDPLRLYNVNVLAEHDRGAECPIVVENTPTLVKLLGMVEREWGPQGPMPSDHMMIRGGSLLRANGGYLILDARDLLTEPGSWKVLVRTLRTGFLEIVPPEVGWIFWQPSLKPEPIPMKVRVILVGDAEIFQLLDLYDNDFSHLFKVLADFDNVIGRDSGTVQYAGVLARIAREEGLPPFDRAAVAALVEHGARVAGFHGKLTARFGRIADIARESAFLARKDGREKVEAADVRQAVLRTKERASLPSRRFREFLRDGTIRVETRGAVVGQVNGLAMIHAGPISYGFPARITATVGAGSAGVIDIEEQAELSGAIHTKGFHILGGLLRHLLVTDHPLAFSASLAFEQSYGSIDGDSASGAEICCLLSALTRTPIRQSLAMTGAIDQHGRIQAIGGVNEKIEGFFDTCNDIGLDDEQGVLIPQSNVGDLMLRDDVVEACREKKFHVYAVATVHEALEILTGVPAGERDDDGHYPAGTLLAQARERAREYWLKSLQKPVEMDEKDGNAA